jgi:hypothetical protein
MAKNDRYNKDFTQKINLISKSETAEFEEWQDEHGNPNFEYLESLIKDGSPEALQELQLIANDLDVDFTTDNTIEELIGKIRLVTEENEDVDPTIVD